MKVRTLFAVALLTAISAAKADENVTAAPTPAESSEPTESPSEAVSAVPTPSESSVPSFLIYSSFPHSDAPVSVLSSEPSPSSASEDEDCTGQPCDKFSSTACSCRRGLECRSRGVNLNICSQVSRTERNRLADSENVGGAAGRDQRGRNRPNENRR